MNISIITPARNSAPTIQICLKSVASQTIAAEHIVVDGLSSDQTSDIVQSFEHVNRYISGTDNGIYDAINKGIEHASGNVIGILNSDDRYVTDSVLEAVLDHMASTGVDCCYGDIRYVDRSGKPVRYWRGGDFERSRFLWGWMPPHPGFFVRKELYDQYGTYRLDLGTSADYEMMLRLLYKHRASCSYIPMLITEMLIGGASNQSIKARLKANRMDQRAWEVNALKPYPWTTLFKPLRKLSQWISPRQVT